MARQRHPNTLPQDRDQRLVSTPYGRGLVVRSHPQNGIQDIQLLNWDWDDTDTTTTTTTSSRQPPMLYSPLSYESVAPMVGDDVLTVYGRGRVIALKPPQTIVVELTSWRLAQRSTVTCYLDSSTHQVQVVRKKTLHEMNNAWERVQHAQELKKDATRHFGTKNFEKALLIYSKAVDAVRNVQHDVNSTNELRADLVLLMITCCNNAATCCIHLAKYGLAIHFSKNALVLIDALYEKRGMKIHSILVKEGLSDAKLFGEYKVKSLLMIAKGLVMEQQGEYADAMDVLKQANEAIAIYAANEEEEDSDSNSTLLLLSQQKQVKRLYATCIQRKKALKRKEKQRAQAMFASPLKETTPCKEKDKQENTNPIVTPSPQPTSQATETDEEELEEISEQDSETSPASKRSVSFADNTKPGSREFLVEQDDDDDNDDDEMPWYEGHKEALVLSAVAGLAALSVVLLRSHRK
jgi:tetratricopeptide (TPR) repeat protein